MINVESRSRALVEYYLNEWCSLSECLEQMAHHVRLDEFWASRILDNAKHLAARFPVKEVAYVAAHRLLKSAQR